MSTLHFRWRLRTMLLMILLVAPVLWLESLRQKASRFARLAEFHATQERFHSYQALQLRAASEKALEDAEAELRSLAESRDSGISADMVHRSKDWTKALTQMAATKSAEADREDGIAEYHSRLSRHYEALSSRP